MAQQKVIIVADARTRSLIVRARPSEFEMIEALIPVNDHGSVHVLIADRVMKEEPWYRSLYEDLGSSFTAACELRFHGHETGNSEVVTIEGGFMVTFYGAVAGD